MRVVLRLCLALPCLCTPCSRRLLRRLLRSPSLPPHLPDCSAPAAPRTNPSQPPISIRYEKQQNAVQKLAKTMQAINDDEVDLDPEDPSRLLHCLDLFEDELKDLEKERGFSISRLKKVALDRLKHLDKEGIIPVRHLISESKGILKGKIATATKEEQRDILADALERLEFIKLDELKACLYGIAEAQLYFHCRGVEKYSECVKLCLAIDPDAGADALEDVIGDDE